MLRSVWIGFDPNEADAFAVARASVRANLLHHIPVFGLELSALREAGLYTRETTIRDGRLFDVISDKPMSTEFAISRFLVPYLARQGLSIRQQAGWTLFVDADVLVRRSLLQLDTFLDSKYAVMVVKHNFDPPEGTKMDGQAQLPYMRKNWSSVMLFNCDHPANKKLTPELVNSVPGRDLHQFTWLRDDEIGELSPEWNFLVGHHRADQWNPSIVHFTEGVPRIKGYENCDFAPEWRAQLSKWVAR